ncbi:hypothetical protein ACFQ4K_23470 [Tistrella bauzanensis]
MKIAVQLPASGETCSSFQVMPPAEKASGNGAHGPSSIWTYSSGLCALAILPVDICTGRPPIVMLVCARRFAAVT